MRARVVLVSLLAASGCAVPPPNPPGTLSIGIVDHIGALDPALATAENRAAAFDVAREVLETLVVVRPGTSRIEPGLAQRWQVASDKLTWTFDLRPGATFSDATPVDALSVKENFDRWRLSNDSRHFGHDYPTYVERFGGYDAASTIDDVEVQGPARITIHTRIPLGPLLHDLALPAFSIGSPAKMSNDRQVYEDAPVGSGRYAIADLHSGDHVTLATSSMWNAARPAVSQVLLREIPDPATALLVLEKDDVDAVADPGPSVVAVIPSRHDMRALRWPSTATAYLGFVSDRAPFDVPAARLAVAEAVNRAAVAADFDDPSLAPATSWIPPGLLGFDPSTKQPQYDPAAAKALFAKAGVAATPVTLYYPRTPTQLLPNPATVAQEIASNLADAGLAPLDETGIPGGEPGGALVLGVAANDCGEPDDLMAPLVAAWHDPGFAAIASNGRATVAEKTRENIYRNLDAFIAANSGAVPLVHPARAVGVSEIETVPLDSVLLPQP